MGSKGYIFAGVVLSLAAHMIVFTADDSSVDMQKEIMKKAPEKCPVTAHMYEEPKPKVKPLAVSKEEQVPVPEKSPPKKQNTVKKVFEPEAVQRDISTESSGNIKIEQKTDEYIPALKMDISDRKTVLGAIRYFHMKVVLLDKLGNFVDEIKVGRVLEIVSIEESLAEYSNRIRMLPGGYFGERISRMMALRGLKPCVLVPADVDKRFAELQEDAAQKQGRGLKEVVATFGRFKRVQNRYDLVIEKLYLNGGREVLL